MTSKFNRKYKVYKATASGPPTERICKRVKCEDRYNDTSCSAKSNTLEVSVK